MDLRTCERLCLNWHRRRNLYRPSVERQEPERLPLLTATFTLTETVRGAAQPFLTEFGNAGSGLLKCLLKQTNRPQDGTILAGWVIRWGNNPEVKCGEDQLDLFHLFTLDCTNTSQSWNIQMSREPHCWTPTKNICWLIPVAFSYCCSPCWALSSCIRNKSFYINDWHIYQPDL